MDYEPDQESTQSLRAHMYPVISSGEERSEELMAQTPAVSQLTVDSLLADLKRHLTFPMIYEDKHLETFLQHYPAKDLAPLLPELEPTYDSMRVAKMKPVSIFFLLAKALRMNIIYPYVAPTAREEMLMPTPLMKGITSKTIQTFFTREELAQRNTFCRPADILSPEHLMMTTVAEYKQLLAHYFAVQKQFGGKVYPLPLLRDKVASEAKTKGGYVRNALCTTLGKNRKGKYVLLLDPVNCVVVEMKKATLGECVNAGSMVAWNKKFKWAPSASAETEMKATDEIMVLTPLVHKVLKSKLHVANRRFFVDPKTSPSEFYAKQISRLYKDKLQLSRIPLRYKLAVLIYTHPVIMALILYNKNLNNFSYLARLPNPPSVDIFMFFDLHFLADADDNSYVKCLNEYFSYYLDDNWNSNKAMKLACEVLLADIHERLGI